jgi:cyclic lactone autoinducer peptide
MTKNFKISKKLNNAFAFILISIAGATLSTASLFLWGEPTPPKSLSKN